MTQSSRRSFELHVIGWPLRRVEPPALALNVSPRTGSWTTPTTGRPSATSAIETQ